LDRQSSPPFPDAWFKKEKDKAFYTYDFGDSWEHEVVLEKVLERDPEAQYPRCTAARRLTPDEDSRGEVIEAIEEYGRWAEKEDPRPKDLAKMCNEDLQYVFHPSEQEED